MSLFVLKSNEMKNNESHTIPQIQIYLIYKEEKSELSCMHGSQNIHYPGTELNI